MKTIKMHVKGEVNLASKYSSAVDDVRCICNDQVTPLKATKFSKLVEGCSSQNSERVLLPHDHYYRMHLCSSMALD